MMEETKRKVAVMQAYLDGKKIQVSSSGYGEWRDLVLEPDWDWVSGDYRVKPEEQYRPYHSYREMVDDFYERFSVLKLGYGMPLIWVKEKETGAINLLKSFRKDTEAGKLKMLFLEYTYLDGSIIGKKVEK